VRSGDGTGVLGDFDVGREGGPNRIPSAKDRTGSIPAPALDILEERAFDGLVPRRYKCHTEYSAWCLNIDLHLRGGGQERSNRHCQASPCMIFVHDHGKSPFLQDRARLEGIS